MAEAEGLRRRALLLTLFIGSVVLFLAVGLVPFGNWLQERLPQTAYRLQQGACFDPPPEGDVLAEVQRHPCNEPHDAEVVAVVLSPLGGEVVPSFGTLINPDAPYPGVDHFVELADTHCTPVAAEYLGLGSSREWPAHLTAGLYYPGADLWADRERSLVCYVVAADGSRLTMSLRAAGASP